MVEEEEEGLKFSSHEEILALPLWNPRTVWVGRDLKSTSSHGQGHSHQDRITCTIASPSLGHWQDRDPSFRSSCWSSGVSP